MKLLVRRYVTTEQRTRDDFGITEDDVMEIRQDISTLRYELIDILHQNGMTTPKIDLQDTQSNYKYYYCLFYKLYKKILFVYNALDFLLLILSNWDYFDHACTTPGP